MSFFNQVFIQVFSATRNLLTIYNKKKHLQALVLQLYPGYKRILRM